MKTVGVKALVQEVLDTLPSPYSEHVTDDVLFAIETNPLWRRRYDSLCDALGKAVVNQWCGQWTGYALGKKGQTPVLSRKNSLSERYSLLDTDVQVRDRPPTEQEATETMAAYYRDNKDRLSVAVRGQREEIIAWIMEGIPVEEAFALALQNRPRRVEGEQRP